MSHLVAASRPIAGAHVVKRYPGHGILGADVPTTGDGGGSPVLNDGIAPAKRYAWRVVTPPTGGTLTIYPDLSFDLVQGAAPDGSYPWTYRLLEDGQDAGTAVVSSTFGTTAVSLVATAISTRPVLGTPTLTEIAPNGLIAQNISTQPITLGSPAIAQTHSLSATAISIRPTLGTPTLTEIALGAIVALGITTSPVVLGSPALAQTHALSAGAIAAGPPTFGTQTLSQQHALMANGIATSAPALGMPSLSSAAAEEYELTAIGITTGMPLLGRPLLTEGPAQSFAKAPSGSGYRGRIENYVRPNQQDTVRL